MIGDLSFLPLVPPWLILAIALAAAALLGLSALRRGRGTILRGGAFLCGLAVLANPIIGDADRKHLDDIVLAVVDRSPSQEIGDRGAATSRAVAALEDRLARLPDFELREITAGGGPDGTLLTQALEQGLGDIPRERLAGVVVITDGRAADAPAADRLADHPLLTNAPLHLLLTGRPQERDRRLTVLEAPSYAVIGQAATITLRVDDGEPGTPGAETAALADVSLSLNGGTALPRRVPVGQAVSFEVTPDRRGPNTVDIAVAPGPDELTPLNNRAVLTINGIRDRLRVLLVSGAPHMGERAWRNLLKADPAVDLVHFTILRPPTKQDGTPVVELSLIAFPTRELFEEKLSEFSLVIFDNYQSQGVLPTSYLDNVARYVEAGGALMVAVSPHADEPFGLFETPLAKALPALPVGPDIVAPVRPTLTPEGRRHPVTALLPRAVGSDGQPHWGQWLRMADMQTRSGTTVMQSSEGRPLLVLDRAGEGRVALLLSDESWLWQRGFDGGGPLAELLRRTAHWLMKEPDLEEEDLRASASDRRISIERRSVKPDPLPVTVVTPSGQTLTVPLEDHPDGIATAQIDGTGDGVYRITDGVHSVALPVGAVGGKEFSDIRASDVPLHPVVAASGGSSRFLVAGLPDIRPARPGRPMAGEGWIGLRQNGVDEITNIREVPLLPAVLALALILGLLGGAWLREGR